MKNKKIIIAVSAILATVIVLTLLVLLDIIPNPFIDNRDLVCTREVDYISYIQAEKTIIEFNYKASVKKFDQTITITYPSEDKAKQYYINANSYVDKDEIKLEKNKVIIYNKTNKIEDLKEFDNSRKKIKKYYEDELAYKCE